jgi:hypothetical protein
MAGQIDGIIRNSHRIQVSPQKSETAFKPAFKVDYANRTVEDLRKRFFLKAIGIGGLGVLLYSLLPKKAQSMVFGSSMRNTDPVGLKNVSGTQINPATEEKQDDANTFLGNIDTKLGASLPLPTGAAIEAKQDALSIYKAADLDDDAEPNYYGFVEPGGNWYILKEESKTYRYCKGSSGYSTAWTNRASQSYNYLDVTF